MCSEQNKAVIGRNIEEALNGGNLAAVDERYHADAVLHMAGEGDVVGRDADRWRCFASSCTDRQSTSPRTIKLAPSLPYAFSFASSAGCLPVRHAPGGSNVRFAR
jgi:hypothetical protein